MVKVYNPLGNQIAQLYGGDAVEDRLILAAASGHYEVMVSSDDSQVQGTIQLLVTCTDQAPGCISGSLAGGQGASRRSVPSCFGDDSAANCVLRSNWQRHWMGIPPHSHGRLPRARNGISSASCDALGAALLDSLGLLEGETGNTYTFSPDDLERGRLPAIVRAGNGTSGLLCVDDAPISFEGETTDQCTGMSVGVDVVPGAARAAVAHWSAAPGATAYLLHIYASETIIR